METHEQIIERASAMPAATWHFLNMNDTQIEVPAGLAVAPDVKVSEPWMSRGAADEFENALADAQVEWEATHPAPTEAELAERAEFLAAEADATYGGTAQSAYQANADAIEEARSLALAFENGTGEEASAYLRFAAGDRIVVAAGPGKQVDAHVVVAAKEGAVSVAAVDVVADAGSTVDLDILVDGAGAGEPGASAGADGNAGANGLAGTTVRVFADAGARVNVVRMQTLGYDVDDVDDMGLFAADDATIAVRQTVLGARRTFTGLAGDLRGDASNIEVDTRYLGRESQEHDFNYSLRHHGKNTKCNLQANGVLSGRSKKTLRGTIDLVRGCKGAEGSENETVLLIDEGVSNKTVPIILCNEDDVAGNHGATIGHIRDEQLFYLASRGLSQEAAERMFAHAAIEQAALDAATDEARAAVLRFGEQVAPGFVELFEE